jgi:hypothetical protein
VPRVRAVVERVAIPAVTFPVPRVVAPSRKVTVPVMVPVDVEETVAVKVTEFPCLDGSAEEESVAVVAALFTIWVTAEEVLAA